MANMTIRVTNATFETINSDVDFATEDDAYRAAVKAALEIAADEVSRGAPASIVIAAVEAEGGRCVARGAVSVSTARLLDDDDVI